MRKFIPKVLLLGNENEIPNDLPEFRIVGKIEVHKTEPEGLQFIFEGKQISQSKLGSLDFDYILCTQFDTYWENMLFFYGCLPLGMLATTNHFRRYVSNVGYLTYANITMLSRLINEIKRFQKLNQILDFDSYLYRGGAFDFVEKTCPPPPRIETILQKSQFIEPIYENVYERIFDSFEEIKLRSYDLIVLTAERSVEELLKVAKWAMDSAQYIAIFLHCDSQNYREFKRISATRKAMHWIPAVRGEWLLIESRHSKTCSAYVVTHKEYFTPKLPAGYEWIHAGKKNSKIDLGIRGDDSGDNISELNSRLDELSVIYWAWKNTRSDFIGFTHYRRFLILPGNGETMLGDDNNHVITMNEVIDLLSDCDILVRDVVTFSSAYSRDFEMRSDDVGYQIFIKHLRSRFPEYLPTLDLMQAGQRLIGNSMFFTRWKVFDEYCKWIFSFIIPAAIEFFDQPYKNDSERREISYMGEMMFHCFLMHNHLKIKYLHTACGYEKDSTPENPTDWFIQ